MLIDILVSGGAVCAASCVHCMWDYLHGLGSTPVTMPLLLLIHSKFLSKQMFTLLRFKGNLLAAAGDL